MCPDEVFRIKVDEFARLKTSKVCRTTGILWVETGGVCHECGVHDNKYRRFF